MEDLQIILQDLLLRAAVVSDQMTTIRCNRGILEHPPIGTYCQRFLSFTYPKVDGRRRKFTQRLLFLFHLSLLDRRGELDPEEGREVPAGVSLNFVFEFYLTSARFSI